MTHELHFSDSALLNRSYFYDGINDVNIFVEDADSQYYYETIFHRLLGEKYRIRSIFPCGGKSAVKKVYFERGRYTEEIKNIYIVDGDFDRLINLDKMINDSHFIYLKMYNIESYIINEPGVCKFLKYKLKCLDSEAHDRLKYADWYNRIIKEAKDLFLFYCFIQKVDPEKPNVGRSHYDFIDKNTGFERTDGKYQSYQKRVLDDYPNAITEIELIKKDYENIYGNNYESLICGKFLISSLHSYLLSIVKNCKKRIDKDELFSWLIESFNIEKLDYIRSVCLATE